MSGYLVIELWPRESECAVCCAYLIDCHLGVPMFEGEWVGPDYEGEWGGFDACESCYKAWCQEFGVDYCLRAVS